MEKGHYSIADIKNFFRPTIKLGVVYYATANTFKDGNVEFEMIFEHETDRGLWGSGYKKWTEKSGKIITVNNAFTWGKNQIYRLKLKSTHF